MRAKDVVRRFIEHGQTATGEWDMAVIEECFDIDRYWSHTWQGDLAHTGARMARFFSGLRTIEVLSNALVAEGDLVVHRVSTKVRHEGEVLGVPATGREVVVNHVEMWRVENGRIVEHWGGLGEAGQLHRALTQ